MTKILLIRHAQAEGNLYRRIQGSYNSLLTPLGYKQVELLRDRLAGEQIDAVYSSDLIRARETAKAAAEPRGLKINLRADLREVDLGVWEDRCWGEVEVNEPQQLYYYNASPDKWEIPGGESFLVLQDRMEKALLEIAAENQGKTVAVFSHGGAIRALMARILHIPPNEVKKIYHADNTAISLLNVENGVITPVYMNDNDHLPEEFSTFKRETWWKEENGNDGRNMHFLPFDVKARGDEYLAAYKDAWCCAHGNTIGFSNAYLHSARRRAAADPNCLVESLLVNETTGLVELAPESREEPNGGHIAFLYMKPEFRGRALASQLIGYAVHYYRALGRDCITLKVAEDNGHAVEFYKKHGFKRVGYEYVPSGDLLLMRLPIAVR